MKKAFAFLSLALLSCCLVACNDDKDDPAADPQDPEIDLVVTPAEGLVFEAEGGTQRLTVEAGGAAWSIEKSDTWINVAPDPEAGIIEVNVGPWDEVQERRGTVTVTGGTEPVTVAVVQHGIEPTLTADPTELKFSSDAGRRTIAVEAQHVDWQVSAPEAPWITVTADSEAGTIAVEVEENSDAAPRNGSFRITGEGVDEILATVEQEGAIPFWERPIAFRMGYRGKVKSASLHLDFVNGPTTDLVDFEDLQFDEAGNLLSFKRDNGAMTVTVTYDSRNRMTSIDAKGDEADFSLLFEYGDHGKYAPIFEIFESYLEPTYYPVDFRSWMPLLIKDLTAIKVRDALMPENNLAYRYTIADGESSIDTDYEIEGYDLEQVFSLSFAGIYPAQLLYYGEESATYDIDPASGKIGRYFYYSYYDILLERSLDRLNTTSHSLLGTLDRRFTYNENGDVASRTVEGDSANDFTAEYRYDAQGNWNSINVRRNGSESTEARTVTYWE